MHSSKIVFPLVVLFIAGCGSLNNDLLPSAADKQPPVLQGTIGPSVGQIAPDFTISDTLGNPVILSSVPPTHKGVVLYFNMWCPICDSDMSYMRDNIIPQNPGVVFFSVDYVSGSVSAARNAEISNGYDGSGFIVLADIDEAVLNLYNATMGTTIVIDKNGVIQMNQDFWAEKLQSTLAGLP